MDRRQKKTRNSIYEALDQLLLNKCFEDITVKDIIDKADIGRSTFYAHFETKELLLKEMCRELFVHLNYYNPNYRTTEKLSEECMSLHNKLIHLLYHIQADKPKSLYLLYSSHEKNFMTFYMENLRELFLDYRVLFPEKVPPSMALSFLVNAFQDTTNWWINNNMNEKPEKVVEYYLSLVSLQ